jgi:hypothetical protein
MFNYTYEKTADNYIYIGFSVFGRAGHCYTSENEIQKVKTAYNAPLCKWDYIVIANDNNGEMLYFDMRRK